MRPAPDWNALQVEIPGDGSVVECDEHHHEDLFWALRGVGGSNFGVVTSLVFRTIPAPAATAFHMTWPLTHAKAVIEAWQAWTPTAQDELAASLLTSTSRRHDLRFSLHYESSSDYPGVHAAGR